jgi:hypothetical protein
MTSPDLSRYASGLLPIFVIPAMFLVVPRAPAHLRAPIFGSVIFFYGSWSFARQSSDTGGSH